MITFSIMSGLIEPPILPRILLPLFLICCAWDAAKAVSPEEFVGPPAAPGSDTSKQLPAKKAAVPKPVARAAAPKPPLDTARIHALYLDGDFDQCVRLLETALRGRKSLSHADSVFAFKHLGVMYAATPATREKGRFYMLQLISIEPAARILDMYASDMIYLIFRNVQEEYENKHGKMAAAAAPADTAPKAPAAAPRDTLPAPVPAERPASARNRTLYWVAGGAAITAGAAGLLFILLDDPQPKKRNIVLPE
jgi:hypothetical protein